MANMAYMTPGVYVNEVPSADKPIAGVGTSTACFIGLFTNDVSGESVGVGDATKTQFVLANYPVVATAGSFTPHVAGVTTGVSGQLANDTVHKQSTLTLGTAPSANNAVTLDYQIDFQASGGLAKPLDVKLCTNFTEFTTFFGTFSSVAGQRNLAHAVYGFFDNGGTRCYVVRVEAIADIDAALDKLEAIDEIAIVAVPGLTDAITRGFVISHVKKFQDRFAIFDAGASEMLASVVMPSPTTSYAALYFPWLQVFDPVVGGNLLVPPSGHVAGIYARVDTSRGVHKAPANEVVLGALGLGVAVSKNDQGPANMQGINCIRSLNGDILVWGARTLAGSDETDVTYINVRRLLLFLCKSIEEGTQWVVFEPNSPALWQKIKRNVTAFLTNVWRDGALFGDTAQQAFYVKCDAETNPPALRDLGQVVTEIGVAIVRPAEFVIFNISQWSGPNA